MTIPVFYSISDDFTKYAAVSLNSLVKNSNPENDYTVIFLNQDLSKEHQDQLAALGNDHVHVEFFHIDEKLVKPIQDR
ncbi:glycosyltransferase family 8 protein, partial [Limosilactobacillus reuteri]